jgi:hypothetical protein
MTESVGDVDEGLLVPVGLAGSAAVNLRPYAPLIIRWGPERPMGTGTSSDLLRQRARCSRCGTRVGAVTSLAGSARFQWIE